MIREGNEVAGFPPVAPGVQDGVTFPGSLTLLVAVASRELLAAAGAPLEEEVCSSLGPPAWLWQQLGCAQELLLQST